jgi:hypothetical protein
MNIDTCWKRHLENTTKASDCARQFAFAGLALTWLLKPSGTSAIAGEFLISSGLLVLALTLDLSQYVVASFSWRRLAKKHEAICKAITNYVLDDHKENFCIECCERNFGFPPQFHFVSRFCFWSKISCVLLAYISLISIIAERSIDARQIPSVSL